MDPQSARRLLFIRTDRLGETVLNLPAAACLKAALPGASLTLLVQPALHSLMECLPWIDRVLSIQASLETPWWLRACRLAARLRRERFDLAVVSNPQKELHAAVWLAGIPIRVGYARKWGGLLTHRVLDRKALGERHEVEYNFDLIAALGIPCNRHIPSWSFPPLTREGQRVSQVLGKVGAGADASLIIVHPWTSNPAKQWPLDRFRRLLEDLSRQPALTMVLIGGPEERQDAERLVTPAIPHVVNAAGALTLPEVAALCQRARAPCGCPGDADRGLVRDG